MDNIRKFSPEDMERMRLEMLVPAPALTYEEAGIRSHRPVKPPTRITVEEYAEGTGSISDTLSK